MKAIFSLSADPIHNGHIDIIKRASKLFEVVVAIGVNADKKYVFPLKERIDMAKKSVPGIDVISFSGLLVDFAYENCISVIVKAVRNKKDFEYEKSLYNAGKTQGLKIKTILLKSRFPEISSTIVKSLQKENGFINGLVPLYVKQCLEARISGQYIIGITGEIGVGKTNLMERIKELGIRSNILVHCLDLDKVAHYITGNSKEPAYKKIRKKIANIFGKKVMLKDGSINRKVLGNIVFNRPSKLKKLNDIMEDALKVRIRKSLHGKKGLILIDAALLAETDMAYLSNNNIILVKCDKKIQEKRLKRRGLSEKQIKDRINSQLNTYEKEQKIKEFISRDNQGKLWIFDNSHTDEKELDKLFKDIISYIDIYGKLRKE